MSREKKFTPGPWNYVSSSNEIYSALKRWVCSMPFLPNLLGEENQANANLIAAAPELLKELESHCKQCMARNKWKSCSGCFTHRAIEKAYGETE